MRKPLVVLSWTAVGFVLAAIPAQAQTRSVSAHVSRLVLAQCPGPAPCDSSGISFTRGDVSFQIRKPGPVFSSQVGRISLSGVVPPVSNLSAVVSARVSYGPDPNGDCPVASTQSVVNPWATSSLSCVASERDFLTSCSGEIHLTSLLPVECSDVDIIIEDLSTEVYESGFAGISSRLIARDGHAVPGRSPDCVSGGIGCP
jgi:hypothetical protein